MDSMIWNNNDFDAIQEFQSEVFCTCHLQKMVHKQHKKYSSYQRRLAPLSCLNKSLKFFLILCITLFIIHLKLPNESRFNSKVLQFMAEFILTYDGRNFLFKQISWNKTISAIRFITLKNSSQVNHKIVFKRLWK